MTTSPSTDSRSISTFDLAVWGVAAVLLLCIALLAWQSVGRDAQAATSDGLPAIVYIAFDDNDLEQLYLLPLSIDEQGQVATGEVRQLTDSDGMLWDYAIEPGGSRIVFSILNDDGSSDLWQVGTDAGDPQPLLTCAPAVCNSPSWSADGQFLTFSLRNAAPDGSALFNPPRPWIMNTSTAEAAPMFSDDQQVGFEARWSADGQWVAYLSPGTGEIGILNLESGDISSVERSDGEPVAWHPHEPRFAYSQMDQIGEKYVLHMQVVDPATGAQANIGGSDALVEDRNPTWSPAGDRLVFRRKELEGPAATLGSQLWLMTDPEDSSTSEARALTADAEFDHGAPRWSTDGRYLLYQRLPLKGPNIEISLWLMDVETGEASEIVRPGRKPGWVQVVDD